METSLLWTRIKHLWAVSTAKRPQPHWSHSPWEVGLSYTQAETMRIRAGTHVYHLRTREVHVLPRKDLKVTAGVQHLRRSNIQPQPIFSVAQNQTVMASNKLSGPVYSWRRRTPDQQSCQEHWVKGG